MTALAGDAGQGAGAGGGAAGSTTATGNALGGEGAAGAPGAQGAAAGGGAGSGAAAAGQGAGDAKAAADKAAADAAAAKPFALKLPEGFQEDDAFKAFSELAQKQGLKQESAQAILDFYAKGQVEAQQARKQSMDQLSTDFESKLKADTEFGGAKYEATLQEARKAIKALADPAELTELKKFFADSPVGNYPPLVKLLAKAGRMMGEGKLEGATSEGGTTATASADAFHRSLYPKTFATTWDRKRS